MTAGVETLVHVSFQAPEGLVDDLQEVAAKNDRNRSAEIRAALRAHIAREMEQAA